MTEKIKEKKLHTHTSIWFYKLNDNSLNVLLLQKKRKKETVVVAHIHFRYLFDSVNIN